MNHKCTLDGYCYRLRPVKVSDAEFIVKTRLEDAERNLYIHKISSDVSLQEEWIRNYLERDGDYYFIVENRFSNEPEGLIAFYNVADNKAEWGRWVIKKGSFAAAESVKLLYKIAFEQVGLDELYCDTIEDNKSVVSFHTSIGEKTREVIKDGVELDGKFYNAVIQYSDRKNFYEVVEPKLDSNAYMIYKRMLKQRIGTLDFEHIGVAVKNIEKEMKNYLLLGYRQVSDIFEDNTQGIRGVFLAREGHPKLELLENLEGRDTVTKQLESGNKMYHRAYLTKNIEAAVELFKANKAKVISPMVMSTFYKTRICFMILPNMEMIELVEEI